MGEISRIDTLIIIVNYGDGKYTNDIINNIKKWPDNAPYIFVYSNSPIKSNKLRRSLDSLRKTDIGDYFIDSCNRGYGEAINRAFCIVNKKKYVEYVWVLNPDTTPDSDMLKSMIYHRSHRYILGINTVENGDIYSGILGIGFWGNSKKLKNVHPLKNKYVTGSSIYFHANLLKKYKFRNDYFLYWEEIEWQERIARSERIEIKTITTNKLLHHESGITGKDSYIKNYYSSRNMLLYHFEYSNNIKSILSLMYLIIKIIYNGLRLKSRTVNAVCNGIKDAMKIWLNAENK